MSDDRHLYEEKLASEVVFKGKLLEVRRDRVQLPDGQESVREYIVHPGAVVIIAQQEDGRLLFERQFRYPLHRAFVELPAGKIDPGEDPLATAKRELLEETGYVSDHWSHLGVLHTAIGYSDERIEIYLARNAVSTGQQALDAGEFLDVFTLSLDEACAQVLAGKITDGKTVTALFWAEKNLAVNLTAMV